MTGWRGGSAGRRAVTLGATAVVVVALTTGPTVVADAAGLAQSTVPIGPIGFASGIATDSAGDLFVADETGDQVIELPAGATSANQRVVLPFTGLVAPAGIAVDQAGDVAVTDAMRGRVFELPAGATSSAQQKTLPFTGLFAPGPAAFDQYGDLYVGDTDPDKWDVVYLPPGATSSSQQATVGTLPGSPTGITVDHQGDVLVADGQNRVFEVVQPGLNYALSFAPNSNLIGVAADSADNVIATDANSNLLVELPLSARFADCCQQVTIAAVDNPAALTMAPDGTLYVVQKNGTSIVALSRYTPTQTALTVTTPTPLAVGVAFTAKATVTDDSAVDPTGTVSVTDGVGDTCTTTLSSTGAGSAAGTCQLTETASGHYTLTATYHPATLELDTSFGTTDIDIHRPPAFTASQPPLTALTGQHYGYTFQATAYPDATYALSQQAPAWLSIDPTTGTVSGTVPQDATSFTYSVLASNDVGWATAGPFTVEAQTPPSFTAQTPPLTTSSGDTYNYQFSTTARPDATYSLNGAAPGWLTIDPSTGQLSGVVPNGVTSFSYSVTATNAAGTATAGPYTVAVKAAPAFYTANPPLTTRPGATYSYTFGASGAAPLVFALDGQAPSWLTVTSDSNGHATVSGTVPGGITSFTYSVTANNDAGTASVGPYTVNVQAPPTFTAANPPLTATAGQGYNYTFTATGRPAPTYSLNGAAPGWLSIDPATGKLTGTVPHDATTFTYSVIATNGAGTATVGPFAVTVEHAPSFTSSNPPLTAITGHQYGYTFTATGTAPITYALDQQAPSWLTIDPSTGTVNGTVPASVATFTYSVTASNDAGSTTAGPYSVAVTPPVPHADVSVKLACPHRMPAGRSKTCTVTVTNTGPQAAAKVKAAVTLGRGLTGSRCRPRCAWTHQVATWKLGRLAAGSSRTLTLHITGHRPGTRHVKAAATSPTTDPRPRNNTAAATVSVT